MNISKRKAFSLGIVISLALFALANFISYPMSRSLRISPKIGLLDDGHAFGFPFAFYFVWGGVPSQTVFVPIEAIINLLLGIVCAVAIGLIFSKVLSKKIDR